MPWLTKYLSVHKLHWHTSVIDISKSALHLKIHIYELIMSWLGKCCNKALGGSIESFLAILGPRLIRLVSIVPKEDKTFAFKLVKSAFKSGKLFKEAERRNFDLVNKVNDWHIKFRENRLRPYHNGLAVRQDVKKAQVGSKLPWLILYNHFIFWTEILCQDSRNAVIQWYAAPSLFQKSIR